MKDISMKPVVTRTAMASGIIHLRPVTIKAIKDRKVEKGAVLEAAKLAAMTAVKQTPALQPYCHNIPISHVSTTFTVRKDTITAETTVKTDYKTGVEMEAVIGVQNALATIWDMTKYLEKDEDGNYPTTRISEIRITKKVKG